ncbi:uncharacterized protein [Physeter macrocephalus]|uniref:Uncharacterized protein isoform X2 n=1 Tax=Physeter macrocephalus TaxID=9755 RepID=A0A455BPA7_PHYMC|nr:uncharacterized protein LOC102985267 isoform X2 [Physeter catodon]|eukprot:XP_028345711.1 uncharacterized protein LOC102985267 isoform X2 [Physeter catodon]
MLSRLGRADSGTGGARRPREPPEQELQRRREQRRRRHDAQQLQQLKHLESLRMRLSQKTVYQMSQAMNMPGNFWPTHQPKDFGCHWGKKSKSCSATLFPRPPHPAPPRPAGPALAFGTPTCSSSTSATGSLYGGAHDPRRPDLCNRAHLRCRWLRLQPLSGRPNRNLLPLPQAPPLAHSLPRMRPVRARRPGG